MTVALSAREIAGQLKEKFAGKIEESGANSVLVKSDALQAVAAYLKDNLKYDYFNYVTAVDYISYFEVVYQVTSMEQNRSIVLKARCARDNATLPSVTGIWQGANFQEREIYDLFGIKFEGHPNLKRMFLWEGFGGYPLRKDWNAR
ncbi:MAG TPA: NADH-quinone oxidoreductase subunit C [Dehalococcoidales bacterium]|nr:NADH-quinone oxidoreductase subunit C [Dehalococcoidales bacterium]